MSDGRDGVQGTARPLVTKQTLVEATSVSPRKQRVNDGTKGRGSDYSSQSGHINQLSYHPWRSSTTSSLDEGNLYLVDLGSEAWTVKESSSEPEEGVTADPTRAGRAQNLCFISDLDITIIAVSRKLNLPDFCFLIVAYQSCFPLNMICYCPLPTRI